MAAKRSLGLVYHGGRAMPWGVGATAHGLVFLSGAEGRDPANDEVPPSMRAQLWMALDKIKERLEEAGTSVDNIVKIVWYITSRDLREEFWQARDEWFAKNAPRLIEDRSYAGTLLIAGLDRPEMLVEVDVIASLP